MTTSVFSDRVHREVIEDEFPLIMIHGKRVAEEVLAACHEGGIASVSDYLDAVDQTYESRIAQRRPEEILLE